MIKIKLIAVGKIKEKYYQDAVSEYAKRLSRFCDLKIVEVKEENLTTNPNDAEREVIKQREGEKISKEIKGRIIRIWSCILETIHWLLGEKKKWLRWGKTGDRDNN